ncbi:MAG: PIN domain-containing protein [Armatimonadota bacterium]
MIVRYLVGDDEALAAKSTAILQAVERGETVVVCDPVQLAEVVWVLSSYYELSNAEISAALLAIVQADGFLMGDKARYVRALRLFGGPVPHFGDACACAVAVEECDGRLYSFDRKLCSVEGISRAEHLPSAGD